MKDKLETRIGYFFVFAVLAAILVLEMSDNLSLFRKTYALYADFHNVNELKSGDPVKLSGVSIGKVDSIKFNAAGGKPVRVTLRINTDYQFRIHADSTATIAFTGLMGQNFVDIRPGISQTRLAAGGVLETTEQANLNSMLQTMNTVADGIKAVTDSFAGVRIDSIVGPMGHFLKDNTNRLYTIVQNLESLSSQMANSNGTVARLLQDDKLYLSLTSAAANIESFSGKIAKGEGTIGKLVASEELYKSIQQVAADLQTVAGKVAKGEGTIGKLVADDKLYQSLTTTSTDLGKVAADLKIATAKMATGNGTVARLLNDGDVYNSIKASTQSLEKTTAKLETFATEATALATDARKTVGTANGAVATAQRVLEKIDTGNGTISRLINDDKLYLESAIAMQNLREILDKINWGQGTLANLLNDDSLFKNARATLQKMDNATSSIEDQGPISVLGILFNGLF